MADPQEKEESATDNLGKPLDPSATKALQGFVSNLRDALLVEANRLSSGDEITDDDLILAYNRLSFPDEDSFKFADAQAVISKALRENRVIEWVAYAMAVVLFLFGLGLILNRVNDPKKVAPLLKDTFLAVVLGKPQFNVAK